MTAKTQTPRRSAGPFDNRVEIQWCPGCPNFGILKAFKQAFEKLGKSPEELCLVSGIGQAAKLPHYLRCNFFNGLHGRALPVATAIKAANPALTTIVVTGDGDCYGEGGNHFLHALRRNPDITVVVHNNEIYALTKGQASPTTAKGERRSIQADGVQIEPMSAAATAILGGCTFVARGYAGDIDHLAELIVEAVGHPGLACLDVIQPCITWGTHPLSWYRERVEPLPEGYDPSDRTSALSQAMLPENRFRTGILHRGTPGAAFGSRFRETMTGKPLADLKPLHADRVEEFFDAFRP
ncbi:thiamine pyrophosphate-dependent enzyme [Desulfatiglans anilini]|uniref:thiamine pyrophosphate-dependent enzyme n=1 Tax=Desulfatiglans anilini TaxID=90728 RepID=UPI0004214AEC|nr:thiamine pyrophosphate-dependent enzyme [Desulfatiglans anilini]